MKGPLLRSPRGGTTEETEEDEIGHALHQRRLRDEVIEEVNAATPQSSREPAMPVEGDQRATMGAADVEEAAMGAIPGKTPYTRCHGK